MRSGVLAVLMLAPPVAGAAIVIDDFDSQSNDDASGSRSLLQSDPDTLSIHLDPEAGALFYSAAPGTRGAVSITWGNPRDPLGVDVAAFADPLFELDFGSVDQAFMLRLRVATDLPDSAEILIGVPASAEAQIVSAPLRLFSGADGVDLNAINLIQIDAPATTDAPRGLSFTLTEIRIVPAPASLALLGVAGFAVRRRR